MRREDQRAGKRRNNYASALQCLSNHPFCETGGHEAKELRDILNAATAGIKSLPSDSLNTKWSSGLSHNYNSSAGACVAASLGPGAKRLGSPRSLCLFGGLVHPPALSQPHRVPSTPPPPCTVGTVDSSQDRDRRTHLPPADCACSLRLLISARALLPATAPPSPPPPDQTPPSTNRSKRHILTAIETTPTPKGPSIYRHTIFTLISPLECLLVHQLFKARIS